MSILRYLGTICFWLFSSESLVMLGNSAGYGMIQTGVLLLLLTPVFFYGLTVCTEARTGSEYQRADVSGYGGMILNTGGFSGIIGTCLFVSTGILVSAGFTFNEVFFYRFPNFAFAFLLLVSAVVVQYLSEEKKELLAGLLAGGAAGCVLLLVLIGFSLAAEGRDVAGRHSGSSGFFWPLLFLFLGFEQMPGNAQKKFSPRIVGSVLVSMLALLLAWGAVSRALVPPGTLAESTIPHMIAAGKIASPLGRFLMGAAVICSALAAVIRFLSISKTFLVSAGLVPPSPGFQRAVPLMLGGAVTSLMFTGVAGYESLETMIRTSLLMWMVYAGAKVGGYAADGKKKEAVRYPVLLTSVIILAACFAVFLFQGEYARNVLYMLAFLAGSAVCVAFLKAAQKLLMMKNRIEVHK